MWDIRAFPPYIPPIPGLNSAHELNVRTYVHYDRVPGVWFFSLDCDSAAAVLGARTFLPPALLQCRYRSRQQEDHHRLFTQSHGRSAADFDATWKIGETIPFSHPGSLEFFLTERYCLYSKDAGQLYRSRIYHQPWPLQKARTLSLDSSMIESQGLPTPKGDPLLHYCEELRVEIWPLEKAEGSR